MCTFDRGCGENGIDTPCPHPSGQHHSRSACATGGDGSSRVDASSLELQPSPELRDDSNSLCPCMQRFVVWHELTRANKRAAMPGSSRKNGGRDKYRRGSDEAERGGWQRREVGCDQPADAREEEGREKTKKSRWRRSTRRQRTATRGTREGERRGEERRRGTRRGRRRARGGESSPSLRVIVCACRYCA